MGWTFDMVEGQKECTQFWWRSHVESRGDGSIIRRTSGVYVVRRGGGWNWL